MSADIVMLRPLDYADDVELVDCPFCGNRDGNYFWNIAPEDEEPSWCISCWRCAADGPPGATKQDAVNYWNGEIPKEI